MSLRKLLAVLPLLVLCSLSFNTVAEERPYIPSEEQTSENLIDNSKWEGDITYGKMEDPTERAEIDGADVLYESDSNTIMFKHEKLTIRQQIGLNTALENSGSGLSVGGYSYEWTHRLLTNDNNPLGGEELEFEVSIEDKDGNIGERYTYDYGYTSDEKSVDVWKTSKGTQYFQRQYETPQSLNLSITGKDGNNPVWNGYYGPEVKDVELRALYTFNVCETAAGDANPECRTQAEKDFDRNCAANPLFDSACPGYQQALFEQQCNADPLSDPACPGYDDALFDKQCSLDPLFDPTCPGYDEALFDKQCEADPQSDPKCDGYKEPVPEPEPEPVPEPAPKPEPVPEPEPEINCEYTINKECDNYNDKILELGEVEEPETELNENEGVDVVDEYLEDEKKNLEEKEESEERERDPEMEFDFENSQKRKLEAISKAEEFNSIAAMQSYKHLQIDNISLQTYYERDLNQGVQYEEKEIYQNSNTLRIGLQQNRMLNRLRNSRENNE